MADVVLRVRFTSGDHTDVRYEDRDATNDGVLGMFAVATLASEPGCPSLPSR